MVGRFVGMGAVFGLLAVAFGAFGAHALKGSLPVNMLAAYQTGVQYQFFHALALLLVAVLLQLGSGGERFLHWSGKLFVAGIILFSGSLYGLALGGPTWLGPVTPLGGLCFLAAWALLFMAGLKMKQNNDVC